MTFWQKLAVWWFKTRGWRFSGPLPRTLKQMVIVAGPHNRRFDYVLGLAIVSLTHFRTAFLVDERYFRFPLRGLLKRTHAIPVHSSAPEWSIEELRQNFRQHRRFSVVFTNKRMHEPAASLDESWYHLAAELRLPVVLVILDYRKRLVRFHSEFYPSSDATRDLAFVRNFFSMMEGQKPHNVHSHSA